MQVGRTISHISPEVGKGIDDDTKDEVEDNDDDNEEEEHVVEYPEGEQGFRVGRIPQHVADAPAVSEP